jgi:hypothetical protein
MRRDDGDGNGGRGGTTTRGVVLLRHRPITTWPVTMHAAPQTMEALVLDPAVQMLVC